MFTSSPSSFARSRTSQEVRGLKLRTDLEELRAELSHLARGAWIEISSSCCGNKTPKSHLARGAWIEMSTCNLSETELDEVAPRKRCVDWVRGLKYGRLRQKRLRYLVAPRKRCVD